MGDRSHAAVGRDCILKGPSNELLIIVNQITEREAVIIMSIGSQLVRKLISLRI